MITVDGSEVLTGTTLMKLVVFSVSLSNTNLVSPK